MTALRNQENRVRADMKAESSPGSRSQLTKEEADILDRQEALGREIGEFESYPVAYDASWPPEGKPTIREILTAAVDKGLATPIDPGT